MDANSMRNAFNQTFEASRMGNMTFNDREVEFFLNKAQLELIKERYTRWKNTPKIGYGEHPVRNSELAGLLTATQTIGREYLLLGNANNGALQGPDLDAGGTTQDEDRFGVFIGLPDEVLYPIMERCNTIKDITQKRNIEVREITLEQYARLIYNSYEKPYENLIWSMDWGTFTTSYINDVTAPLEVVYTESSKSYTWQGTGNNMAGTNYLGQVVNVNTNRSRYLIPGKGWKITGYMVNYIKLPTNIHIDIVTPSLQRNCVLAEFLHQEIVDKAVVLAAASITPVEGKYQVTTIESAKDE
jgi:hypothetical protein